MNLLLFCLVFIFFPLSTWPEPTNLGWEFQQIDDRIRFYLGAHVIGVIGNRDLQLGQINVSRVPAMNVPRNILQWQKFAIHSRQHTLLRRSLVKTPRPAFLAEIAHNNSDSSMRTKILFVVDGKSIVTFTYSDPQQIYTKHNALAYQELFNAIAHGRRDDLLRSIANTKSNALKNESAPIAQTRQLPRSL